MSIPRDNLRLSSLVALACLSAAGQARAEDDNAYFSELPLVASASRLPQRLADAPTAMTVIDRDLIKASGARDLNDIFRLVPGFQTYPNNTESARVTYHGMGDGDYAPRLQVMIDGRSMYSPLFGGGVNWATLPVAIEDIERIEVVRGSNAVSYGSNAFLGVINIITVDPALVRGSSVSTSYGNQNVRDYLLRTGGKIADVGDFRFTYKQQGDDGLTNRGDWIDSYASRLFDLRADFALSDKDSLQFSAGQAEGVTQLGRIGSVTVIHGLPVVDNPIRDLRQTDTYLQFLWRRVYSSTSDIQLRYSYVNDRSSDAFSTVIPSTPIVYSVNQSGDEGTRHEIELQHSLRLDEMMRFVWGASWRDDAMRSAWALPGQGTVHRQVTRLFNNAEWKPASWFTGNVGLAGEEDSLAGFHASPRISGNFHLNPENTLRVGYSRAYRTAGTVSYLGSEKILIPGVYSEVIYTGDRNLPVEQLDTCEIGYLGEWRDWRASLDVRLFNEHIHNRIFEITTTNGKTDQAIQNVDIRGVEYQFKWQPFETTRLVLNQTFSRISSEYLASALVYPGSTLNQQGIRDFTEHSMPGSSTSLLLMQKLPYGLDFSLAGYWQEMMKWTTNTSSPAYERYDARLGYPFRFSGFAGEVAVTVQSLNGAHHEYKTGTPAASDRIVERRQWVSLRLDF